MDKMKKRIGICILFAALYAVISICVVWHTNAGLIKVLINNDEVEISDLKITKDMELNDCIFADESTLTITGADPYMVFRFRPMWVWNITLNITDDYSGNYKVYYGLNKKNISEDRVALLKKDGFEKTFFIGKYVDLLRIDFEEASIEEEYHINEEDNIIFDKKGIDFWRSKLWDRIEKGLLYAFVIVCCSIYQIVRRQSKCILGVCVYSYMTIPIVVNCMINNYNWSVQIWILIIICFGLFFWAEILEEEKWKIK